MAVARESERKAGRDKMAPVPDNTSAALAAAMFTHDSPKELCRQLSIQAALLERHGHYDDARRTWVQAAAQAQYDVDRHWCESRAQWCELCHRRQK
ncbi:ANR family transcriptional regulator [Serratia marcescens]|uniref:ANR family transcriptional regulator n=1 Tax=Serratia marcescens TaxID=615 RepID=UPI00404595C0